MFFCIFFTSFQHILQRVYRWGQDQIIITITINSSKDTSDPASRSISSENGKEIVCIKTIKYSREDRALSYAVSDGKDVRKVPIPINITKLVHVNEEQESHKDDRESTSKKLLEKKTVLDKIEGLGHVHKTGIDIGAVPHEVVYGLNCGPGTHGC